jgi:D-inositol-3-phosphate glycosyltransferase
MRVAMVSEHASPLATLGGVDAGGQNVFVAGLATALARQAVAVRVYTRRDRPGLPRRIAPAAGVVVEHVDAGPAQEISKDDLLPFMPDFAHHLSRAWDRWRPDVVHAHFWMSGWASLRAAAPLDLPIAQTFHALGVVKRRHQGARDPSPPERLATERQIVTQADRILATCSDELFELVRLGVARDRVVIVPCGVDLDLFRPAGPAAPPRRLPHRVVIVSRLVERKGIGNAISALAGVPECELVVAGGPARDRLATDPEFRRFHELAVREGVADRVRFLGALDRRQVPELVRSADLVACVPWYEPFGMVALESMACGVPVVASAVGGLVDTVIDGVTGVHVPPRRPDRMAQAMKLLIDRPDLRRRLGAAALDRARARYGWEQVARQTLAVYRELTAPRQADVARDR